MKKHTDTEKKAEIKKWVEYWQERLCLQNWEVILRWSNKLSKEDKKRVAHVLTDNYYLFCIMTFILPAITSDVFKDIKEFVLHEMIHVILNDYDWLVEKFAVVSDEQFFKVKENTVETLTRIIMRGEG